MKKFIFYLFWLFIIGLMFTHSSCDKPEPEPEFKLPPLTSSGQQTFGCEVDGKLWLFGGTPTIGPSLGASYYKGVVALTATRKDKEIERNDPWEEFSAIGFSLKYPDRGQLEGEYLLENENRDFDRIKGAYGRIAAYSGNLPIDCKKFVTDSLVTGKLTILKHDTLDGIVSGTFEFRAINEDPDGCKDTIVVKNGRFDIEYLY